MPKQTKNNPRAFTQHYYDRKSSVFGQSGAVAVSALKSASGKNSAGFTLIEVMVVIAIVSIMTGVVIASLGKGRVQRELETNAREFAGVVREAQNYALTGKQISGNTACSFYVVWRNAAEYTLEYTYRDGSGDCTDTLTSLAGRTHSLKHGVMFANTGNIAFALPWANTNQQQANFQKLGSSHSVCVSDEGKISDQAGTECP